MTIQIKGSVLHARRTFVESRFGAEAWQRLLETMSPSDRRILDGGFVNVGWYPFELGERLGNAIVRTLGEGGAQLFMEIGAHSARENLSTVHKDFLRPGDPQAFLARAPAIYKFYYDRGYRTYVATGPTSGTLMTFDAETYSKPDCLTVMGWYREALEMCGARDVSVSEETCRADRQDACRYLLSWRSVE